MATLTELQTRLAEYRAAESAILKSQEYTISDGAITRRVRRADLQSIQSMITQLEADIAALTPPTVSATPAPRRVIYPRPRC